MMDPQELLADYVTNGSEAAFREIVTRYLNLVYSVALRRVDGDTHLAEDVAQGVFIDLARLARKLPRGSQLGGWLHRHTCFVAAKAMRSNRRRRDRESQAVEMNAHAEHSRENLARVAPLLDEAINQLGERDRMAILLRFFEQQDLRAVGGALGTSENAAQKRVTRALEALRVLLKRRGVVLTGAALAAALSGGGVTAAPAGLAISISGGALAGIAAGGGTGLTLMNLMTLTKLKTALIGTIAVAGVATPLVLQYREQAALRTENLDLRQQVAALNQLHDENSRLKSLNDTGLSQGQLTELMQLRSEVGNLRRQTNETGRLREQYQMLLAALAEAAPGSQDSGPPNAAAEQEKRSGIAKLNFTRNWMLAWFLYAEQNGGQFPERFEQALPFLPDSSQNQDDPLYDPRLAEELNPDQYEIVFQGPLTAIENPAATIVLREKEAWPSSRGGWNRSYGFADGHSEIHRSPDGNFEAWEAARRIDFQAGSANSP